MFCSKNWIPGYLLLLALTFLLSACAPGNLVEMIRNPFSYGLFAFILLILDLLAIYEIVQSSRTTGNKLLWILLIVFFPFVGLVLYFLFGRE